MQLTRRRTNSEDGAVAVLVAILAIVLFAAGALAVDLGNAYARSRAVQLEADFAALSVGELLPAKTHGDKIKVADAVAEYLNNHHVPDDDADSAEAWTATGLLNDGWVHFPSEDDGATVVVATPPVTVTYSLARVLGFTSVEVNAKATVAVRSPGKRYVAPLYAVQGCDYGEQSLKSGPKKPVATDPLPPLPFPDDDVADVSISSGLPTDVLSTEDPAPVLSLTGDFLSGTGANERRVSEVGFFRSGLSAPLTVAPTAVTNASLTVQIPADVMSEGIWYLRFLVPAKNASDNDEWSVALQSDVVVVGDEGTAGTCPPSVSNGNFGQLDLGSPGDDENSQNAKLAESLIHGPAVEINRYPGTVTAADAECTGLPSPAIQYPNEGANCIYTLTGNRPPALELGLFTGLSDGTPGRLYRNGTHDSCDQAPAEDYNSDYLSCFFTNDSVTIEDITNPTYSADDPVVLSKDIFDSPRFFLIPVFAKEPVTGTKSWKVTGFRPAFLTEQPGDATRGDGPVNDNGIIMGTNGKPEGLRFILFDEDALPRTLPSGTPAATYYGSGPRIVTLID